MRKKKLDRWLGWDFQNQPALSWPETSNTLVSMTILIWLEMPEMFDQEALVWFMSLVIHVFIYLIFFFLLHSNRTWLSGSYAWRDTSLDLEDLCQKLSPVTRMERQAHGHSVRNCGWTGWDDQAISPYFSAQSFQRLVYFFSQKSNWLLDKAPSEATFSWDSVYFLYLLSHYK